AVEAQFNLGIDRQAGRERDLPLGSGKLERAHVTGRPGRAEEVLGRRVRLRHFKVQKTIAAARGTLLAVRVVSFSSEENFLSHKGPLSILFSPSPNTTAVKAKSASEFCPITAPKSTRFAVTVLPVPGQFSFLFIPWQSSERKNPVRH
ncbi:MAG TPA: hypothetical protein VHY09_07130, partial [Candidatus Methylacidiphilales bacterium]|nr:hypothetical protein [Candidatus Methylacidiphilales bacterium]